MENRDITREKNQLGCNAVDATIKKIDQSGVFDKFQSHEQVMDLMAAPFEYGEWEPFKMNGGGIFGISKNMLSKSIQAAKSLNVVDQIQKALCIDWNSATWEEMNIPIYSGLALRILIANASESGIEVPKPVLAGQQVKFVYNRIYDNLKNYITEHDLEEKYWLDNDYIQFNHTSNHFNGDLRTDVMGTKCMQCSPQPMDIIFAVDNSASRKDESTEWYDKFLIVDTVRDMYSDADYGLRVGFIDYTYLHLVDFKTIAEKEANGKGKGIKYALDKYGLETEGVVGGGNLSWGLDQAWEMFQGPGSRFNDSFVTRALITFTDGSLDSLEHMGYIARDHLDNKRVQSWGVAGSEKDEPVLDKKKLLKFGAMGNESRMWIFHREMFRIEAEMAAFKRFLCESSIIYNTAQQFQWKPNGQLHVNFSSLATGSLQYFTLTYDKKRILKVDIAPGTKRLRVLINFNSKVRPIHEMYDRKFEMPPSKISSKKISLKISLPGKAADQCNKDEDIRVTYEEVDVFHDDNDEKKGKGEKKKGLEVRIEGDKGVKIVGGIEGDLKVEIAVGPAPIGNNKETSNTETTNKETTNEGSNNNNNNNNNDQNEHIGKSLKIETEKDIEANSESSVINTETGKGIEANSESSVINTETGKGIEANNESSVIKTETGKGIEANSESTFNNVLTNTDGKEKGDTWYAAGKGKELKKDKEKNENNNVRDNDWARAEGNRHYKYKGQYLRSAWQRMVFSIDTMLICLGMCLYTQWIQINMFKA